MRMGGRRGGSNEASPRRERQGEVAEEASSASWAERFEPKREEQLIVNKKKVVEVRSWLQAAAKGGGRQKGDEPYPCRALLLSGPAGCGKTTLVRVLARELQLRLQEWTTPVPTLWHEHQHLRAAAAAGWTGGDASLAYQSKLDAFINFLDVARKFRPLPLTMQCTAREERSSRGVAVGRNGSERGGGSKGRQSRRKEATEKGGERGEEEKGGGEPSVEDDGDDMHGINRAGQGGAERRYHSGSLLLIDDIPFSSEPAVSRRICAALRQLALFCPSPVVVIMTEGMEGQQQQEIMRSIEAALTAVGAAKVSLNPIPPTSLSRLLSAVALSQRLPLSPHTLRCLVQDSRGDLRFALQELQLLSLSPSLSAVKEEEGQRGKRRKRGDGRKRGKEWKAAGRREAGECEGGEGKDMMEGSSRDSSLSMFHALGKLLYNKRLPAEERSRGAFSAELVAELMFGSPAKLPAGSDVIPHTPSSHHQQQHLPPLNSDQLQVSVAPHLQRLPLDMEAPESIIEKAALDTSQLLLLLHENVLDALHPDDASEDAAMCLSSLSDSDLLSSQTYRSDVFSLDDSSPSPLLSSSYASVPPATSVAARGVLFSLTQMNPNRRFHHFRGSSLRHVEERRRQTNAQLVHLMQASMGTCQLLSFRDFASEIVAFRKLSIRTPEHTLGHKDWIEDDEIDEIDEIEDD